jgi:flagellar motor switch protein FliM
MSEVLDQDEINALLTGVDAGKVDTSPRVTSDPPKARYYDFSTQTRIVRGRLPTLESINERIARTVRISLNDMMSRPVTVDVLPITTPRFGEFATTFSVPTSFNMFRLPPLSGTAIMIVESRLVFAIIDAYFGGSGRGTSIASRDFTLTEQQIIQMVLERMTAAMQDAWKPVLAARVEFTGRESDPRFVNVLRSTETAVVSRFDIQLAGNGGDVQVVFPYVMLDAIRDTLHADVQPPLADSDVRWAQLLRNELEESEVDVTAKLGSAHMTVGSLIDMRPGDFIPMDFDGRATVHADGIPLFCGDLGQQQGRQVIRVNQMNARKSGNALDSFMKQT